MDITEAIKARHSVRSYTDAEITGAVKTELENTVAECSRESGLQIRLCLNEPGAFSTIMARYGRFTNVRNYIVLAGKKNGTAEERGGYYGELRVLKAQQLGLSTCWVAMSYGKGKVPFRPGKGEKIHCVIAVGYGATQGTGHSIKSAEQVSRAAGPVPEWFRRGVEAALLAPTAINQQKFMLELDGNTVTASAGKGFYTKLDLGIVKYHFETGAGTEHFTWA